MDYPVALISQLKQHLRSLRKASGLTQAELANRLGVGQSRVADIEANPGAVSVEQLLQVLTMLNAQMVVRDLQSRRDAIAVVTGVQVTAKTGTGAASIDSPPADDKADPPQGQW
jgi:HTH-type transcriptional regulator/antitoxin HipB